jgi:hypothetical protein
VGGRLFLSMNDTAASLADNLGFVEAVLPISARSASPPAPVAESTIRSPGRTSTPVSNQFVVAGTVTIRCADPDGRSFGSAGYSHSWSEEEAIASTLSTRGRRLRRRADRLRST